MLNDFNKRMIKNVVSHHTDAQLDQLRLLGPAFWIEQTIACYADWQSVPAARADRQNLIDNREEAEQYLAGLLGMM